MAESNNIESLRELLFDQLERLYHAKDSEIDKEVKRTSSIVHISNSIIDTAKVELDFRKVVPSNNAPFFTEAVVVKNRIQPTIQPVIQPSKNAKWDKSWIPSVKIKHILLDNPPLLAGELFDFIAENDGISIGFPNIYQDSLKELVRSDEVRKVIKNDLEIYSLNL